MSHAYTMFAESAKKTDAQKRGRFNVGEKLVLALCDEARIVSTTGAVSFGRNGERQVCFDRTDSGSRFEGVLRLTKAELAEIERTIDLLQPPADVTVTFNGRPMVAREPLASFEATLPTVIADAQGVLRRSTRKTTVSVFAPASDETAMIYELGIPIVQTGDLYHVSIGQKVPLSTDRDNVPPAYLREVRALVLNAMHERIDAACASETWVDAALESERVTDDAVRDVVRKRFGDKAVIADPSDVEATHRAVSEGYTVVHGGAFSKTQWSAIKDAGALTPAGAVFPTPKADEPAPSECVPSDQWSAGMADVVALAERLGSRLLGKPIRAHIVRKLGPFAACYGGGVVTFNLEGLGEAWFSLAPQHIGAVIDLLVHELAHDSESNHLAAGFHSACTRLAGAIAALALAEPALFRAMREEAAA